VLALRHHFLAPRYQNEHIVVSGWHCGTSHMQNLVMQCQLSSWLPLFEVFWYCSSCPAAL
ncbi:hypothetical protein TorRG33x02_324220, partial [Trema orientale]